MLTYWVHSALAILIASIACRHLERPTERGWCWKAALITPLVSASTTVFAVRDASWRIVDVVGALRPLRPGAWPPARVDMDVTMINGRTSQVTRVSDGLADPIASGVVALAAALAVVALTLAVVRRVRLRRLLSARQPVDPGRAAAALGGCDDYALYEVTGLGAPITAGTRAIHVPPSFWELTQAQQRVVLTHEAEHLRRRDPWWFGAAELLSALLAFQPLNRMAVRGLRREAEFICDDAAVHRTGAREELVESLARFATAFDPATSMAALGAPYRGSPIVARALRILGDEQGRGDTRRGLMLALTLAGTILLSATAPAIVARARIPAWRGGDQISDVQIETRRVLK
jgi:beta-lactamase regulating signal transducer with metallopeptidase domain